MIEILRTTKIITDGDDDWDVDDWDNKMMMMMMNEMMIIEMRWWLLR